MVLTLQALMASAPRRFPYRREESLPPLWPGFVPQGPEQCRTCLWLRGNFLRTFPVSSAGSPFVMGGAGSFHVSIWGPESWLNIILVFLCVLDETDI